MKEIFAMLFRKKSLTRLVSKDWLLKFVSLALAIVLWYFVGGEDRIEKNVMVPIEIINLPRDLVISNQFKKEIEVTVSGPRSLILEMANRALTRQVDLSTATPGTMVIENDNKHIPVLRGITVQRVKPSSIILSLDKLIQKKIPVEARTIGRVAHGFSVKSLKIDPEVITIAGPHTILSQVDHFYTKVINLDGVKQSMQLQVPLELDPTIVELIGETSVTADLMISAETTAITFDALKVAAIVDGKKKEIQPDQVKVVANIPKFLLDKKIDLKTLLSAVAVKRDGEANLKVKIVPRADLDMPIEIISVVPDSVRLMGDGNGSTSLKNTESIKVLDEKAITSDISPVQPTVVGKSEEKVSRDIATPIKIIKNTQVKVKH
ncbi:MAG: CdaR family protein [Pseudomonadota bacterium]